jgi:hypothetical protein
MVTTTRSAMTKGCRGAWKMRARPRSAGVRHVHVSRHAAKHARRRAEAKVAVTRQQRTYMPTHMPSNGTTRGTVWEHTDRGRNRLVSCSPTAHVYVCTWGASERVWDRGRTDLDDAALWPGAHEEYVGWLEVAVQNPIGVHVRQAIQNLPHDRLDHVARQVRSLVAVVLQDLLRAEVRMLRQRPTAQRRRVMTQTHTHTHTRVGRCARTKRSCSA